MRKRQRAKTVLQMQQNMKGKQLRKGDFVFRKGEEGKELYVLEEGEIKLSVEGHTIAPVKAGELTGEHSLIFEKPRNIDAICASDTCKMFILRGKDFYVMLDSHAPSFKEGIRDICLRREFKKALTYRIKRDFPITDEELRAAFRAIDTEDKGFVSMDQVRPMLREFDASYTEKGIQDIMNSVDLNGTGSLTWSEFQHLFGTKKENDTRQQVQPQPKKEEKRSSILYFF